MKPVPKSKRGISLLAMPERGKAFSREEDVYSRLIGAGFRGAGCMGNEATSQRSRVHLREGEIAQSSETLHSCPLKFIVAP